MKTRVENISVFQSIFSVCSKTTSIETWNASAILKASSKDGVYLYFSIEITACREMPTLFAKSSCVQFRSARNTLILLHIKVLTMEENMKKYIAYVLCIAAAGICLSGCSKTVEQKNESLHVYAGLNDQIMNYAVEKFKDTYPDIPVTFTQWEGDNVEEIYDYDQQLAAQLMSGEGADVFFLQGYWDIDKLLAAGAFADLTEIYDSSGVFHDGDIRDVIMDAGVIGGKRVFLPMDCSIPLLITTEEALQETGFDAEKCTDFDSFMEESGKFMLGGNYDRRLFQTDITARGCLYWAGYPIVEDREIVWDMEETRKYYEWYREFYKRENGDGIYVGGDLSCAADVRDKECLFANPMMWESIYAIRALHTVGEPYVLPIYNRDGGITAMMDRAAAVRANSENLGNVKKFLEILFDGDTMRAFGSHNWKEISVRRSVNENDFNYLESTTFRGEVTGFPSDLPMMEREEYDAYYAYADQINRVIYPRGWMADFREEMSAFLRGEASYEEAAENAKKKLEFYLSE